MKDELREAIHTSRYLPLEDRKNQTFHDLLVRLYGTNQVRELALICSKDVLQTKLEHDHANALRLRDIKIEELQQKNRDLQAEIERLKSLTVEMPTVPAAATAAAPKSPRIQLRPIVPAPAPVAAREKNKGRQTLKPISVQFGTKPNGS